MLEDLNHHALGFVTWLDWSSLSSSYDDSVKVTNSREKGRKFKYKRKINVKIGKSRCHHWKESKHTLISTKYFLLHIHAICSWISPIILESYLNRKYLYEIWEAARCKYNPVGNKKRQSRLLITGYWWLSWSNINLIRNISPWYSVYQICNGYFGNREKLKIKKNKN